MYGDGMRESMVGELSDGSEATCFFDTGLGLDGNILEHILMYKSSIGELTETVLEMRNENPYWSTPSNTKMSPQQSCSYWSLYTCTRMRVVTWTII